MQHSCLHEVRTSLTLSCVFKPDVCRQVNVKVKTTLEQATRAQRGRSCIALLFLLPWRVWSTPRPGRFTSKKDTVRGSERVQKISPPPGFDSQSFQSVASSYTD